MDRLSREIPTKSLTVAATQAIQRFDALIQAYNTLPGVQGDILTTDGLYGILADAAHWTKVNGVGPVDVALFVGQIMEIESQ